MNLKIIFYILSRLCSGFAWAMVAPVAVALYYGEDAYKYFLCAIAIIFCLAVIFKRYGCEEDLRDISIREGIGTVFFTWILCAIMASLPYAFSGILDPISSYFESMSGLSTTGATAIENLDVIPHCIFFWRSMTHWIGGIGIIVLFVALLPQIAGGAVYLFTAEVSGFSSDRILPRIRTTAVALFYIYLLLTVILMGTLILSGLSEFEAINHAFATIATGGFSIYNDSVGYFNNPLIEFVIAIFMILAGCNFALYYNIIHSGVKSLWQDLEFKIYITIITVATIIITINIVHANGYSVLQGLRYAFFQVASFTSTTGFVSCNYDNWPSFSKLILAVMYFSGGCAGSTAGGIKICRFIVLMKTTLVEIRRTLHPQTLPNVYYSKKIVTVPVIMNISQFFYMYILVITVLAIGMSATGLPVEEAIFGVAACVSSVGPAFGSLGAEGNYAGITSMGKIILSFGMVLGRLELFTVLALLRGEFWSTSKRW
ncbi:MAG: TrkH family potassium uptake protein [Phascolarctobacterium sp.]|nr:TrkH family potassium uptake protein [Phascolarctobacterium sp.]